jgi:hypothetical protein
VRGDASLVAPLSGVTTSAELATAATKMGQLGAMITAAIQVRTQSAGSGAVAFSGLVSKTPTGLSPLLSAEVGRVTADMTTFVQTLSDYSQSEVGPQAIGQAARQAVLAIHAVQSTCAR